MAVFPGTGTSIPDGEIELGIFFFLNYRSLPSLVAGVRPEMAN